MSMDQRWYFYTTMFLFVACSAVLCRGTSERVKGGSKAGASEEQVLVTATAPVTSVEEVASTA